MHLRLVKDWKNLKAGHEMPDYPDGAAKLLIQLGYAEDVNGNERHTEKPSDHNGKEPSVDADRSKAASQLASRRHKQR